MLPLLEGGGWGDKGGCAPLRKPFCRKLVVFVLPSPNLLPMGSIHYPQKETGSWHSLLRLTDGVKGFAWKMGIAGWITELSDIS